LNFTPLPHSSAIFALVMHGGVGGGDAPIDCLLQQHLPYFSEWKAAFARRQHAYANFFA
jgi:hypothetical protein